MQDLFYEDDSVLFIDMHQNEVWPGTGQINEAGRGKGEGTTINVPMPGTYSLLPLIGKRPAARIPCRCDLMDIQGRLLANNVSPE